jgi:hypothetical protein
MSLRLLAGLGSVVGALAAMAVLRTPSAWQGVRAPTANAVAGVRAQRSTSAFEAPPLVVPHAAGSLEIDGEIEDTEWAVSAKSGGFVSSEGRPAVPASALRAHWGDGALHVALYAADLDVRSTSRGHDVPLDDDDRFILVIETPRGLHRFEVSAGGALNDARARAPRSEVADFEGPNPDWDGTWESGASVGVAVDGTLNAPTNWDEEWTAELSIPLDVLGLRGVGGERLRIRALRCEARAKTASCGSWGLVDRPRALVLGE